MATLVSRTAELISSGLRDKDRILVLGAGGWFGRTLLGILAEVGENRVLACASRARTMRVSDRSVSIETPDSGHIREFSPTVVVNLASLTPDHLLELGEERYRAANAAMLRDLEHASGLPEVRAILTASSGAAITMPSHPYGQHKQDEEQLVSSFESDVRSVIVARTYSVSGPWLRNPERFAFSDLIRQAAEGRIRIAAAHSVIRRYVDVADYLAVCLADALAGRSGLIESGGPEVEIGALAVQVAAIVPGSPVIERPAVRPEMEDRYCSDGEAWRSACLRWNFVPLDLPDQIDRTWRWLSGWRAPEA